MTDRTPDEIQVRLHEIMGQVRDGKEVPRTAWEDLKDAYNLLSALKESPGKGHALLRMHLVSQQRATAAREEVFGELKQHREAVQSLYAGADQYLRAIQLGGYAAAFGIWAFTRDYLSPTGELWTALLLLFSAFFFVGWEVVKGSVVSYELTELHRLTGSIDTLLSLRLDRMIRRGKRLREWLPRARFAVWFLSVGPAFAAVALLACAFVANLFGDYISTLLAR